MKVKLMSSFAFRQILIKNYPQLAAHFQS
jgi:hypothetical protein